ncbi:hypothetical protein EJ04DRAFT_580074 [Polyplosphaeria fusca]|uniref:BAH domain-containing protein n=1 Tax=Polyplosphaeria fusca TaxID=682080 RepID=A0A9P4QRM3_9PLEO|nr:hypothetical protein EJ04DRAFT_580074 [Polyplosphaeria fusca]
MSLKRKSDAPHDSPSLNKSARKRSKKTSASHDSDLFHNFRGFKINCAPKKYKPPTVTNGVASNGLSSKYQTEHATEVYGIDRVLPDIHYKVEPASIWQKLKVYQKFSMATVSFTNDEFVYIKADASEDQNPDAPVMGWVARILEVRAADQSHVFLRVLWMYRPEDLPGGRQPYHAKMELIASNEMAVIDAMTVDGKANVRYWEEGDNTRPADKRTLAIDELIWRQTINIQARPPTISTLPKYCTCRQPFNPDGKLHWCSFCKMWWHEACLEEDLIACLACRRDLNADEENEEEDQDLQNEIALEESNSSEGTGA